MTHYRLLEYPLASYPFQSAVADSIMVPTDGLSELRFSAALFSRAYDQSTLWHHRFYNGSAHWEPLYRHLIHHVIAAEFTEPFYYQRVPTFRVHLPDNVAVGAWHRDSDYGHPDGEITFWLPVTRAYASNTVWIDDNDRIVAADANPGQIVVFDSVNLIHGNFVNETGHSRVSFDFRCIPASRLPATPLRSINMGLPFAPGGYYARDPVEGTGNADDGTS